MKNFEQIDVKANLIDVPNPRIGVVTLSTDFTIEQDYRRICHNIPIDTVSYTHLTLPTIYSV